MFLPKVRPLPLFYWFVNFTLTDKHGTKNLWGLTCPCSSRSKLATDAFMFHLSLADLNKKYGNEIEMDKK